MRLKKYMIPILFCVLGCMLLLAGCGKSDSKKEPETKTVTVTDCIGRGVELPQPLDKVVILNSDVAEAMRILKVQDTVVGVSETVKKDPYLGMEDKELIGKWDKPSYEKIVELKPQVVISYSKWPGEELAEKLEPAGVKVVHLDLYKPETYDNDFKTLGKMFGQEKKADSFLKWKAEKIATLDKVKDLPSDKRVKVFFMTISNFEKEKWGTFGSGTAAHQGIEMAGGNNVARELKDYPDVSPEWILQQNPEVLVFADTAEDYLGFKITDYGNVEILKDKITKNKVFSKTDAVQKDRIYLIRRTLVGADKTYLGALYLAKWFYPDQFKDLDPDKVLKEYYEKWLDIPFQGKWAYPPTSK